MTLPRVKEINAYQKHSPPVHIMVAAYMGVGKSSGPKEVDENGQSLFDLVPRSK